MSRVLFAVLLAVSTVFAACGGKDQPGHTPPDRKPDQTYTVRGEVTMLPVAGDKRSEFKVKHEAIDDFKNKDGKVVGMSAMTMEFPPAKGVDVSALKRGDKVSVTFSVWWGDTPPWLAVKVVKLADGTELVYGPAKPPAGEPGSAPKEGGTP